MKIRRVVTGHTPDGKATVASDTKVDKTRLELLPGTKFHKLWSSDEAPTFPDDGSPRPAKMWFPPVGGFRFATFTVAPQSVTLPKEFDREAASAKRRARKWKRNCRAWCLKPTGNPTIRVCTPQIPLILNMSYPARSGLSWMTARRYTLDRETRLYRTEPVTPGATRDQSHAVWWSSLSAPTVPDGRPAPVSNTRLYGFAFVTV